MASPPSPNSRCASRLWDERGSNSTAHDMSMWSINLFKTQQLWDDRENADFEIHCADQKTKVHKTILRAHSGVLAKTCDNRSFKEAIAGVLQLKANLYEGILDNLGDGDDPEIVEEMIHYFYHLELSSKARVISPRPRKGARIELSLVYLARVYVLAEKYFIEGLKATVICDFCNNLISNVFDSEIVEACLIIYKKTVEPAGEIGLKTMVAKALAYKLGEVMRSKVHDELFSEIPELAISVLKEVSKLPNSCNSRRSSSFVGGLFGLFDCNKDNACRRWPRESDFRLKDAKEMVFDRKNLG